jgi:HlyD family type I secretion membrane fusion protein
MTPVATPRETNFSPTPIIIIGVAILVLFFGGLGLWAYFAPLHAAVHAQGEVVYQTKRQAVQHQEGGIVRKILVKDGDSVEAGQPLILLEDDQVRPIVDLYDGQAIAETASIIRLEAEKDDLMAVKFPKEIPATVVQTETKLFNAKRDAYLKQVDMVKSQLVQIREQIKGTQEQLDSKKQELASIKEQLDANKKLLKDGYVTKTVVLDLERALAEKNGEREQIAASIAASRERLAEYEQKILSIKAERVQQAANEIKQSGMKRIELEERVRPSRATLTRSIIRAPIAGNVVGLKITTVGGVVVPREPLMEIVPQQGHLIIEAKVGVNDISDIKLGQEAEVALTAFKSSTTPPVKATVTYISDDRLTTRTAQGDMPYFGAYLELDQKDLAKLGDLQLVPGMQAQVSITTRARTAFDYFVGPLRERMRKVYHAK